MFNTASSGRSIIHSMLGYLSTVYCLKRKGYFKKLKVICHIVHRRKKNTNIEYTYFVFFLIFIYFI